MKGRVQGARLLAGDREIAGVLLRGVGDPRVESLEVAPQGEQRGAEIVRDRRDEQPSLVFQLGLLGERPVELGRHHLERVVDVVDLGDP